MANAEVLSMVAIIVSALSFLLASISVIWLLAQKLSTHRVEYISRQEHDALRQAFAPSQPVGDEQLTEPLDERWKADMSELFGPDDEDAVNSRDILF